MKFVLATWGSRGDIEPNLAVGRELVRRGHEVKMAVPPDLVAFTESAGPEAVPFGPNSGAILDAHRDYWTCFFSTPWKLRELARSRGEIAGPLLRGWQEMSATLMSLADGADLIFSGINFEDAAANVAEHYGIPHGDPALLPAAPQQSGPAVSAGAVEPRGRAGVLVGVLARDQEGRGHPAPRTGPPESHRLRPPAHHRKWVAGSPGLRRGLLSGSRRRVGPVAEATALRRHPDAGLGDGHRRRGRRPGSRPAPRRSSSGSAAFRSKPRPTRSP